MTVDLRRRMRVDQARGVFRKLGKLNPQASEDGRGERLSVIGDPRAPGSTLFIDKSGPLQGVNRAFCRLFSQVGAPNPSILAVKIKITKAFEVLKNHLEEDGVRELLNEGTNKLLQLYQSYANEQEREGSMTKARVFNDMRRIISEVIEVREVIPVNG